MTDPTPDAVDHAKEHDPLRSSVSVMHCQLLCDTHYHRDSLIGALDSVTTTREADGGGHTISTMVNMTVVPAAYVPMRTIRSAEYTAPGEAKVSWTVGVPVRTGTHKIQ